MHDDPPTMSLAVPPPRRELPRGTVTFLFTDIEGSTALAETLADAWPALLARHREIIRAALGGHGGVEVQTEGDGFFAVFTTAQAALSAAVEAQRGLAAEPWPAGAAIRVRMGLHAGEGMTDAEGSYVGHDVHRAARVAAAGHGGQILLSATVRSLVASSLPDGVVIRDLGEHRLKDLRPQPISQLDVAGLASDFPPIRSLDSRPNNLPVQVTSFIGREHELEVAAGLLARTRLLTLTGPGGTGKTRLALQLAADAAQDFPDGVWFVALEPLRDARLVLPTVAHTLGIMPRANEEPIDAVAAAVREQRLLLVLDNFEQVIEAAGDVGGLLRACPLLTVIVTSRAVLRVAGEQEYVVPGLPVPPDTTHLSPIELEALPAGLRHVDAAALDQYEAVRLFVARARAVRPDFVVTNQNAPAIAGITARLHGMPLAIELAAARVKLLTTEQILGRLEEQLGILTSSARDLPDRQRTLRGAIGWSHDLLDEPHRRLLEWLSVFRGGWELEAAEALIAADGGLGIDVFDGLADLVDQSLVRRSDDPDDVRFAMLESIREFAAEARDKRGDGPRARELHAHLFLRLAEEAAPHLQGADSRRWLDRLERDHDNLRAALAWAMAAPDPSTAVGLVFALWRFWQQRGHLAEARRIVDRMDEDGGVVDPELRARLAEVAGGIAYWQADLPAATRWYDEALSLRRAMADPARPESMRELANALYNRGYTGVAESWFAAELDTPPDPAARTMMEESLAIYRSLGDAAGEANLLWGLGGYSLFSDTPREAEAYLRESVSLQHAAGNRTMEAWSLHMLSTSLLIQDRVAEAGEAARDALGHFSAAGDVSGIVLALDVLAGVAVGAGDPKRGGRLIGAARRLQLAGGIGLADWDRRIISMLPFAVEKALAADDIVELGEEGATLTLEEIVAYAKGEIDPFALA
jgi:predicted ATPase/class 3 adenylate cyclase